MNQGPKLVNLFVNANIRKIEHLDVLLTSWDNLFNVKNNNKVYPNGTIYYHFLKMILTDKMQLRIINDFVYFQTNDIVRMALTQFKDVNNFVFLSKWFLIFENERVIDNQKGKYDYDGCLFNNVLEACFPRFQICARYICLSLVQAHKSGVDKLTIWNDFSSAVSMLLLDKDTFLSAKKLLHILHNRHFAIYNSWDPSIEVYPGSNSDN